MKIMRGKVVIGESSGVLHVGNEYYLDTSAIKQEFFVKNNNRIHCPDKGYAECFDVTVGQDVLHNGAWVYPHPYPNATAIKGKIGIKQSTVLLVQ